MASFVANWSRKESPTAPMTARITSASPNFPQYGKLSKKDFSGMLDGARVDVDEYEKDSARDFALWKAPKPGEASWDTAIGPGRPGWHLECSVMSMEELGETFDLHAGGEDLIFPHHENEIAQSESLTGKPFAHFWFHARFLLVEGEKMSKSLGNFFTLRDLVLKGHKPSSIRYLLASVPYRNQLNFTFDGLKQAAVSVERLRNFRLRLSAGNFAQGANRRCSLSQPKQSSACAPRSTTTSTPRRRRPRSSRWCARPTPHSTPGESRKTTFRRCSRRLTKFDEIFAVLDDDDGPKMKRVFDWAADRRPRKRHQRRTARSSSVGQLSDADIEKKIAEMKAARTARDFKKSDAIRAELADAGILVEITKDGIRWRRK